MEIVPVPAFSDNADPSGASGKAARDALALLGPALSVKSEAASAK